MDHLKDESIEEMNRIFMFISRSVEQFGGIVTDLQIITAKRILLLTYEIKGQESSMKIPFDSLQMLDHQVRTYLGSIKLDMNRYSILRELFSHRSLSRARSVLASIK